MAIMEQRHFGFEIRVDEEAGRFAARVLRNGEMSHKVFGERAGDAFEEAWCWACVHRPIQIRVASNLIEHVVEYEDPFGGRAKVYRSTVKADADEAVLVLQAELLKQWRLELDEHVRRRDNLAAEMEELAGKVREVEAEIEPLKEKRAALQQRMRDAPGQVYRPAVEFRAVDELPLVMERRKAGGRFVVAPSHDADPDGLDEEDRAAIVVDDEEMFGDHGLSDPVVTDALQRQAHVDMNTAANGPRRAAKKVERKTSKK